MRWVRRPFLDRPRDRTAVPRIEQPELLTARAGGPVIFVDPLEGRWSMVDLVGPIGAPIAICTPFYSPRSRAAYRLFIHRSGAVRLYAFARRERRDFDVDRAWRLQCQFERSREQPVDGIFSAELRATIQQLTAIAVG